MGERTPGPWVVEEPTLWIVATNVPKGRMHVADIRGWGYLTGKGDGALGMSYDDAFEIQKANAAFIVKAGNSHDDLITALRRIVSLDKENAARYAQSIAREALAKVQS